MKHLLSKHKNLHEEVIEKQKKLQMKNNSAKKLNKVKPATNVSSNQILKFLGSDRKVLEICTRIAIHAGVSFNAFDNKFFKQLINFAKRGAQDNSLVAINPKNIKDHTLKLSEDDKISKIKSLKGKFISLSADLATCMTRSFIGEFIQI